jgi:hypothetical protein
MTKSNHLHQIISRSRTLVGALLDSASLFDPDAKSDTGWSSNRFSAFIKVLIRFKNA